MCARTLPEEAEADRAAADCKQGTSRIIGPCTFGSLGSGGSNRFERTSAADSAAAATGEMEEDSVDSVVDSVVDSALARLPTRRILFLL